MKNVCYLSGLGMMGRRHLKGLVRAGYDVVAFDPSEESANIARKELSNEGLSVESFSNILIPNENKKYELAIFAETAQFRYENVSTFLKNNTANRFLLEKPLSANPAEVAQYSKIFRDQNITVDRVSVNYPRRTWSYVKRLRELSKQSKSVKITINGGAFGFGCNGIHYIDMFTYIVGGAMPVIKYSSVSKMKIESGRGGNFSDFGGEFILSNEKGSLYCSGSATSSANVVMSVVGDDFYAWVDERDLSWRLMKKDPSSSQPVFRFGWDYLVEDESIVVVDGLDVLTSNWAAKKESLPNLDESMRAHHLLHAILLANGIEPPFSYT
jgi:predicted dehydrogenase